MFSEKLDFLMNIIGISGGELAHAISLDPSYISRLRHGKRELPKEQHFMNSLAHYFSEHIKSDYQKKLLYDAMGYSVAWPSDREKSEKCILKWLLTENAAQRELIQNVIQRAAVSFPVDMAISIDHHVDLESSRNDKRELYYGIEGKREAFLRFLVLAADSEKPLEMHMYSDEDLGWLSEDPGFSGKTLSLLTSCAKDGKKIKIVHPLRQDEDAMLYVVRRWIPVYLTGYVEPYYYPIIRDELYYRTVFVIPGVAAMISSSAEGNLCEGITFFLTEPRAVAVAEAELAHLISLSKPLAKVFSAREHAGFWPTIKDFISSEAEVIMLHDTVCPFTMLRSLSKIKEKPGDFQFDLHDFETMLKRHPFTEVVAQPNPERICSEKVPLQFSEIVGENREYLTKDEYVENLNYVIQLLSKRENYNLIIRHHTFTNMFLCIKKGVGILLSKADDTAMTFYINQPNVLDAAWEFLSLLKEDATAENRENVLKELQALGDSLK